MMQRKFGGLVVQTCRNARERHTNSRLALCSWLTSDLTQNTGRDVSGVPCELRATSDLFLMALRRDREGDPLGVETARWRSGRRDDGSAGEQIQLLYLT